MIWHRIFIELFYTYIPSLNDCTLHLAAIEIYVIIGYLKLTLLNNKSLIEVRGL